VFYKLQTRVNLIGGRNVNLFWLRSDVNFVGWLHIAYSLSNYYGYQRGKWVRYYLGIIKAFAATKLTLYG